jgi:hypothetical protein
MLGVATLVFIVASKPHGIEAYAQELTVQEQMPLIEELSPNERAMTEDGLRFAAKVAIKQWQALEAEPAKATFDSYFEIFREVARIESLEHAMQTAGVDTLSRLASVAAELRVELNNNGVSARDAALKSIERLVSQSSFNKEINDPEALKVRYTLVLDYISGIDAARVAIALAEKLDRANRPDMALDIYSDFLPHYFDDLKTAEDRAELISVASANASTMAEAAMFRILTNILRTSPRAEKASLAQIAFTNIDGATLKRLSDTPDTSNSLLIPAWYNAVELAQGRKTETDLAELREKARNNLETPAFEILFLAEKDEASRNRIASDAVLADIGQNRALIGYDRALNLPLEPENSPEAYLALLKSFADAGYDNYVTSLVTKMLQHLKNGSFKLAEEQVPMLLASAESVGDGTFVLSLKDMLPNSAPQIERSALRADIKSLFKMATDQRIGSRKIVSGSNFNNALVISASLINGELTSPEVLPTLVSGSADDVALLETVSARLWQYGERRQLLVDFMRSGADAQLKQAVALGVTGFAGFEAGEPTGTAFVEGIVKLLPSLTGEAETLLSASAGVVSETENLQGAALQRYVQYLAATRQSVEKLVKTSTALETSAAVFGDIAPATTRIKAITDYRERLRQFRSLAEARATVLDDKGWLNSAVRPASNDPLAWGSAEPTMASDGRISVAATGEPSVSASARPFMPNMLIGRDAVAAKVPAPTPRESNAAIADISKRGETRATRLIRFSSEHFDEIINLGVREYLYLSGETTVPRIIFVTRGVMTISELVAQVRATAPDAITVKDREVILNVPLAVNDGASLIVSGQEITALRFNTKAGAFLVNSGKLYFDNVTVSSFDEATETPSYISDHSKGIFFRPFILSWSGSETYATDSHFEALGYAGGRTYGMSLSSGSTDTVVRQFKAKAPTGYFIGNSFNNLYYGFYAFEAEDIVFVGNELMNGVIYGLDPHDRSKNLMMAYNTAYGTEKKHGIIISREVDDSFILGNLSFENQGTGIMLDRESYGTIVYANDASRNVGDGFSAMESPCALVESNMFSANGRSGVKIRNSWDVQVESNAILNNKSAGIEAYIDNLNQAEQSEFRNFEQDPYLPVATLAARDNLLQNNRVGLLTRGASEARLVGNRFIDQLPRYVGGDLKPLGLDVVVQNSRSGSLIRSVCMPKISIHKVCSLVRDGVIGGQSLQREFDTASTSSDLCINTAGSPQAAAYNASAGE